MSKTAERTDPKLWEEVKAEVKQGSKGGEAGEWSARKAQLAVQEYKKRGGSYRGGKSRDNALRQWTEEKWSTKSGKNSGKNSGDTGERYMPKAARQSLADEEYRATSEKNHEDPRKGKQFPEQPEETARKTARHRLIANAPAGTERRKTDLLREAKQLEIDGRSRMNKEELAEAIRYAKH